MSTGSPSLRSLIEQPFGPYLEQDVLSPDMPGTTALKPIRLEGLVFEWGGFITGLTECEPNQPEFDWSRDQKYPERRFRASLEIQSLSWLKNIAAEKIEAELRERDLRARKMSNPFASRSSITLKHIYVNTTMKIKVTIDATRSQATVYLLTKHVPNGLMVMSMAHKRRYAVKSMHVVTYELSRLYFSRWRLMKTLHELLALDANINTHTTNNTPLPHRTPEWFADLYIEHMAYAGEARQHRLHYVSDSDSDVQPCGNGKLRPGREHVLRHVSRAEVLSRIAEHGRWVVQEVRKQQKRLIDVDVWEAWLRDARRIRWEAAQEGRRWGVWEGDEIPLEEPMEEDLPLPVPIRRQKRRAPNGTNQGSTTRRRAPFASPTASTSHASGPRIESDIDDTMQRTYDSDFSVDSDVPEYPSSPSESSSSSPLPQDARPLDPDVLLFLPPEFFQPPQPSRALKWACPVPECPYIVDLVNLTDENLDTPHIPALQKARLRQGPWAVHEGWVREAFGYIVDKHYETHLEEWGIVLEIVGGKWRVRWKHPESHPPINPARFRQVRKDTRRPPLVSDNQIKEEDRI